MGKGKKRQVSSPRPAAWIREASAEEIVELLLAAGGMAKAVEVAEILTVRIGIKSAEAIENLDRRQVAGAARAAFDKLFSG